jgi:hypothetical protein
MNKTRIPFVALSHGLPSGAASYQPIDVEPMTDL